MKRIPGIILILLGLYTASIAQDLQPAPSDKAVVYFTRTSVVGFAINFTYFDSTKLISRFNGGKYVRYECLPGKHLFWARSENRDFVEAEVEAGKIYFIESIPKMGAVKAGVMLVPIDPTDPKSEKQIARIIKLINKKPPIADDLLQTENFEDVIERGIKKYEEEKNKGVTFKKLTKTMHYNK